MDTMTRTGTRGCIVWSEQERSLMVENRANFITPYGRLPLSLEVWLPTPGAVLPEIQRAVSLFLNLHVILGAAIDSISFLAFFLASCTTMPSPSALLLSLILARGTLAHFAAWHVGKLLARLFAPVALDNSCVTFVGMYW